jgi:hypothetical protein
MLFYQTIDTKTLELLKGLMLEEIFKDMYLVGGTSLALQIGHRKSIDIDLFGKIDADEFEIQSILKRFGSMTHLSKSKNINIYSVNNIKIDIVNYPFPLLEEKTEIDGIRLAGLKDIAAMKLSAIAGRGSKKDFIDLYFLLQKFSLSELFHLYKLKYKDGSEAIVLKSLTYFDDADNDIMPVMLQKVTWNSVKEKIKEELFRNFREEV